MKKLIVTADDYGVFPSVNAGIIAAVNAGKVNSVAVFANYPGEVTAGGQTYLSSTENVLKLMNETDDKAEIGCHLTVTSGQPLTDNMDFLCEYGNFVTYDEFRFFGDPSDPNDLEMKWLKEELHAQIDVLSSVPGVKVKHLTCHHNSLTIFEHHYKAYLDVARTRNLPIRSANIRPDWKQNLYLKLLRARLRSDIEKKYRKEITGFGKRIVKFFEDNRNGVTSTSFMDSRHYGPIPPFHALAIDEQRHTSKKHKLLDELFEKFAASDETSLELMLHLADDKIENINYYEDLNYSGVDRTYFDSRLMEYKSIMSYPFSIPGIERKGWGDL